MKNKCVKKTKLAAVTAVSIGGWMIHQAGGATTAAISWGSAFEITTQADINIVGRQLIYAQNGGDNWSSSTAPTTTSPAVTKVVAIDGINVPFQGLAVKYAGATFGDVQSNIQGTATTNVTIKSDPGLTRAAAPQSWYDYSLTGGARTYAPAVGTGSAGLDSILADYVFADVHAGDANVATAGLEVWLNNLTPGTKYEAQIVGPADTRGKGGNDFVVDDHNDKAINLDSSVDLDGKNGAHVSSLIGTFSADASGSEHFEIFDSTGKSPGFSAIILTTDPVAIPEPVATGLVMMSGLLLVRRRRA